MSIFAGSGNTFVFTAVNYATNETKVFTMSVPYWVWARSQVMRLLNQVTAQTWTIVSDLKSAEVSAPF
jgi:hypothetical protein